MAVLFGLGTPRETLIRFPLKRSQGSPNKPGARVAGTFTLSGFYHRDENPVRKNSTLFCFKKASEMLIPNTLQDVCGNLGNPTRFHHPLLSFCLLIYKMMLINTSAIDEQCEFTCCQELPLI